MKNDNLFMRMINPTDSTVSSGRFLTVVTVLTVLYTWAVVSIYTRTIVDIPTGVYAFVAIVVTGKTLGMFAEAKAPPEQK